MTVVFEVVMERLKAALKIPNDKELARLLGLKPNAFYNRKRLGSVPYECIVETAEKHKLCVDWVLFGFGKPFRDEDKEIAPVAAVEPELLTAILGELERAFQGSATERETDALAQAALRGALAAYIYNKVAFVPNAPIRNAMIRSEAEAMAHAAKLTAQVATSSTAQSRSRNVKPRGS